MPDMTTEYSHHLEYWRKVKRCAADTLARICDEPCPTTKAEVVCLLAHVLECGCHKAKAEAIVAASEWAHACNEIVYKEEQK